MQTTLRTGALRAESGPEAAPHDEASEDAAVFLAAQRGDAAALNRLMIRHRVQAVRYAMRLCVSPADAEDAAQEALLSLSRYVASLRAAAALSTWMFTAIRTHCMRLARRSLRARLLGDHPLEGAGAETSVEDLLVDQQLRLRLADIVAALDEGPREVLVRRDMLGHPASQVAAELGISVDAVKSRLHRARTEVKTALLATMEPSNASSRGPGTARSTPVKK